MDWVGRGEWVSKDVMRLAYSWCSVSEAVFLNERLGKRASSGEEFGGTTGLEL